MEEMPQKNNGTTRSAAYSSAASVSSSSSSSSSGSSGSRFITLLLMTVVPVIVAVIVAQQSEANTFHGISGFLSCCFEFEDRSPLKAITGPNAAFFEELDTLMDTYDYRTALREIGRADVVDSADSSRFTPDELVYLHDTVILAKAGYYVSELIERRRIPKRLQTPEEVLAEVQSLMDPIREALQKAEKENRKSTKGKKSIGTNNGDGGDNRILILRKDRIKRHIDIPIALYLDERDRAETMMQGLISRYGHENFRDVLSYASFVLDDQPQSAGEVVQVLTDLLQRKYGKKRRSTQAVSRDGNKHKSSKEVRMAVEEAELHRLAAEAYSFWLAQYDRALWHYSQAFRLLNDIDGVAQESSTAAMVSNYIATLAAKGQRAEALAAFGMLSEFSRPFKPDFAAAFGYDDRSDEIAEAPHRRPANRGGKFSDGEGDLVRVFDNAQTPTIYAGMLNAFREGSSFWEKTHYSKGGNGGATAFFARRPFPKHDDPARTVVHQIVEQMLAYMEPEVADRIVGVEWWVHKRPMHPGITVMPAHSMHFDMDEATTQLIDETGGDRYSGVMRNPVWSSVTFVEGDTGGATLVMEWESNKHPDANDFPTGAYLVTPKDNRFMLFRGTLHHGVLPGFPDDLDPVTHRPKGQRITLLVNFWDSPEPLMEEYMKSRDAGGDTEAINSRESTEADDYEAMITIEQERQRLMEQPPNLAQKIPELRPVRLPEDQKTALEHATTDAVDIKPLYHPQCI
eukprot:Clim_evm6s245 gene=Clim_evmTU6s245